jgi:cytochrome b involved in lipid metabolism
MHSTHHKVVKLVPLDTFFLDLPDHIYYVILTLGLPLLFIENFIEYGILVSISLLHSVYLHSDISDEFILPLFINSKYHTLHHTFGKGNYSIFFSFWDDYMGTRLKEFKVEELSKSMNLQEFKEECVKGRKLTIINGAVIDCASWIDIHPGGKSVIMSLIGKDSTSKFNMIHGDSKMAKEMLKKLKVADLST